MQHCLCCGRKKLPFAEYSVVKDQVGATPPTPPARTRTEPLGPVPLPRWEFASQHVTQSVNVGSIGGAHLSKRLARRSHATAPDGAGAANGGRNNLPDVGGRETQEPQSLTETFKKPTTQNFLTGPPSRNGQAGLPSVARRPPPLDFIELR